MSVLYWSDPLMGLRLGTARVCHFGYSLRNVQGHGTARFVFHHFKHCCRCKIWNPVTISKHLASFFGEQTRIATDIKYYGTVFPYSTVFTWCCQNRKHSRTLKADTPVYQHCVTAPAIRSFGHSISYTTTLVDTHAPSHLHLMKATCSCWRGLAQVDYSECNTNTRKRSYALHVGNPFSALTSTARFLLLFINLLLKTNKTSLRMYNGTTKRWNQNELQGCLNSRTWAYIWLDVSINQSVLLKNTSSREMNT